MFLVGIRILCFLSHSLISCSRVGKLLKSILLKCEDGYVGLSKISEEEHNRELSKIYLNYDIHGLTWNAPYTDIDDIISQVQKTNIHVNDNPKAEFALAVHIVPYCNRICSVWLYLASFTAKE